MNKFTQHIPTFVETEKPVQVCEFETTEDLLKLETVQRFGKGDDFSHFAISDNNLMEISDDGFSWWVVGFIDNPKLVNLPQWEGWKFRAILGNGDKVILGKKEVVSSCGGVLTLKDGTKAIKYKK